ncbi:hypothetical protein Q3H58_003148 [Pseudomonas psychrotolerans]|nr:hypothetical protein [Pseudomonas psychrotolerans]
MQQPTHRDLRAAQGHQVQIETDDMTVAMTQALTLAALERSQPLVDGRLRHQQAGDGFAQLVFGVPAQQSGNGRTPLPDPSLGGQGDQRRFRGGVEQAGEGAGS